MFQRHYEAVARKRRLAEKARQGDAVESAEWHQWGGDEKVRDVGNLSPQQLLDYLIEQRRTAAGK